MIGGDDLGELSRELSDLIAAEKATPVARSGARAAVRAKVAATVGHAPLGAAATGATIGGKLIVIVAVAAAAGGGGLALYHRHAAAASLEPMAPITRSEPVHAEVIAPAPIPTPSSSNAPPPPERAVPHPAAVTYAPAPAIVASPPAAPPTPAVSPSTSPPSELTLLRDAWSALARHDATRALDLVDIDARLYPSGALGEERAALHVAALAGVRRRDEASHEAEAFLLRYPTSVHRALVEQAIHPKESP